MPSATTHICVSKKLNKTLKIDEYEFRMGNLVPDSWRNNSESDRCKTHFSPGYFQNEDYIKFYTKYKNYIKSPFVLGYLTHLMTDFYYRNYVNPRYLITYENKKTIMKKDGTPFLPPEKHGSFFRKNKTFLTNYLTHYFKIDKQKLNKKIINPIEEVNFDSFKKSLEYINNNELIDKVHENEIFDYEDTLKDIDACCEFILNELKKLNLM